MKLPRPIFLFNAMKIKYLAALFLLFTATSCHTQWDSESTTIESEVLSRTLAYLVYDADTTIVDKPIVYLTDGKKVIDNDVIQLLAELTTAQLIPSAYYVFLSSKDPETEVDYRNEYFFCNPDHLAFFEKELIPHVEESLPGSFTSADRHLIGFSFGGMNAAYFSAKSSMFAGFGLFSPITYPCESLTADITFSTNEDLRIFISTGQQDAEKYVDLLEPIYRTKGYQLKTLRTEGGHNFDNWNEQWEELINFLLLTD